MSAIEKASNIIEKYCIRSPDELNLEEILYAENLKLKEEPLSSCEGEIIFDEDTGIITLNSKISDERQKRFTLAHEMGHFFNERKLFSFYKNYVLQKYECGFEEFYGKNKGNNREAEANEFAAELLMHKPWYQNFIRNKEINFDLIKEAAEYFNVTLTAAALRYVFIGQYPVGLIMSREGKVIWSAVNEYFPLKYIPANYKVRKYSTAYEYFNENKIDEEINVVSADVWFGEDFKLRNKIYFYEQNMFMRKYDSVLTLLWEWKV